MPYPFKVNPITSKLDMVTNPSEMIRHIELADMPDVTGSNTDHDTRYALQGLFAALPLPGVAGRRYWCTDILVMLRDTGAAWIEMVRGETVTRLNSLGEKNHASLANVLPNQHHAQIHKGSHVSGGGDAFVAGDLLDATGRVIVRKNTGANIGARRRLNLIEGTNIGLTISDSALNEEVLVTINQSGVAGANHATLANLNWAAAGHTIDADVNFAKFKAIAMVCDNGATLPAAPVAGQWFLHTPTGRNVLMQYSGTVWIPIISLSSMTMYVDSEGATHGDNQNYGYSSAVTFDTVQFAIDQIP